MRGAQAPLGARRSRRPYQHVGSTSIPGLAAKPIVDIALEVPNSAFEHEYLPDLQEAGYTLRIREPAWFEHRVFHGPDTDVNLHTFPACQQYADAKSAVVAEILGRAGGSAR